MRFGGVRDPLRLLKWRIMTTALSPFERTSGRRRFFAIALIAMLAVAIGITGCTDKGVPSGGMPPLPVLAAKGVERDVPNQLHEIGTVEAFESIAIKVRVGGNLQTVNFKEGDFVKKGQRLLVIDP